MARGRPRRAPITREQIVDAAFRIVDAEGLDALTMRRLGAELGIEAASLYHRVSSRADLLHALVVRLRSQVRLPDPMPTDWAEAMEAIFASYAAVLTAHPHLVPLAGRTVDGDPQANGLTRLLDEGLSLDDATDLWQSIHALTIGYALLASASVPFDATDVDDHVARRFHDWRPAAFRRSLRMLVAGHRGDLG